MNIKIEKLVLSIMCAGGLSLALNADEANTPSRRILSLQECRDLAIIGDNDLKEAKQNIEIAGYDRKIAMANYFPDISATATYLYNSKNINLLSEDISNTLNNAGTSVQNGLNQKISEIVSDPQFAQIIANSEELQKLLAQISSVDIATPINTIGHNIDEAFTLNIEQVMVGVISLKQPVFVGGKIINANKMAALAEELAQSKYDMSYNNVISQVDAAYWQIVSIAGKKRLAEAYSELLHKMENDVELQLKEGVATNADKLSIKVKANEADMLLTKATNGLSLAKMLLCKLCGLDLYTDITLADENADKIPVPQFEADRSDEDIFSSRPEIKSLTLATRIYERKTNIARADMLPTIALTANYLVSNPNCFHGFSNSFSGMFNAGVVVSIPLFHGFEAVQKVNKAKAEAVVTQYKLDNAKQMVALQVSQLRQQRNEALERLASAESNLESAEENLRTANIGFSEGVIPTNTVFAAQTAWLQAHSEYIDASVDLQLCSVNLNIAEGKTQNGQTNE